MRKINITVLIPDDDFIDLVALVRNIAHDIYDTGSPFE